MKHILFSCILLIGISSLTAQTIVKRSMNAEEMNALEVKDSAGTLYPMAIWQKLVSSGKYTLKMSPDRKSALLYPLTEEEINQRLNRFPKPKESNFFKDGQTFSPFSERDIKGEKYSIKDLRGKVVVLNFWFINCPPCRQEIPQLNELVDKYRDNKDVVFIAVALDEKWEIEDFLKTNPYKYHIIDRGRYIANGYGINLYPTHVVLNKEGKILFHTSGLATNTVQWIRKSIEAGLADSIPQ